MKNFDADRQHIAPIYPGYLYACSFTAHLPEKQEKREAFDFYRAQAVRHWKNFNLYCQAATALALHRYGDTETATAIIRSLKERARRSEAMGSISGYACIRFRACRRSFRTSLPSGACTPRHTAPTPKASASSLRSEL